MAHSLFWDDGAAYHDAPEVNFSSSLLDNLKVGSEVGSTQAFLHPQFGRRLIRFPVNSEDWLDERPTGNEVQPPQAFVAPSENAQSFSRSFAYANTDGHAAVQESQMLCSHGKCASKTHVMFPQHGSIKSQAGHPQGFDGTLGMPLSTRRSSRVNDFLSTDLYPQSSLSRPVMIWDNFDRLGHWLFNKTNDFLFPNEWRDQDMLTTDLLRRRSRPEKLLQDVWDTGQADFGNMSSQSFSKRMVFSDVNGKREMHEVEAQCQNGRCTHRSHGKVFPSGGSEDSFQQPPSSA